MKRLACFALFLSFASFAPADTLHFKDGRKMEGTVVKEDEETVTFKKGSIVTTFKKEEIAKIEKGGTPVDAVAADATETAIKARCEPCGVAEIDTARAAAWAAWGVLQEKRKALATSAKRTESQTKAFESQLQKVKQAEAKAAKTRESWARANAARVKAQDALDTALRDGNGKAPRELQADVENRTSACNGLLKAAEADDARVAEAAKKLEELRAKYDAAAMTLKPAIGEVATAIAGLDAAWAAVAAAEKAAEGGDVAWMAKAGKAARVRIEGRVVKLADGVLTLATGVEEDAAKWKEEVTLVAPGLVAQAGDVLVVVAVRNKDGLRAIEVIR